MRARTVIAALLLVAAAPPARALPLERWLNNPFHLDRLNRRLSGHIVDYTFNHGRDNRLYSPALDAKRDLYVYLPPGYDPCKQYPLAFFFHGFAYDEESFLEFVRLFDEPMARGALAPMIIAVPDGSLRGRATILNGGSFYVNSKAGRYEDYVMRDVWDFVHRNYPVRPEREAHVLIGGSMGGYGAYHLGIKHRDRVGVVAGIFPPLNLRYLDCHGHYFANYDPACLGWRTRIRPWFPIGRYAGGLVTIRERRMVRPLFGRERDAVAILSPSNPVEMLDHYSVRPGELEMFVAYVGRDQFNIDAQIESFLHAARCKGLTVSSVYDPAGKHNTSSGKKLIPSLVAWLAPRLEPFAPPR